MAREKSVHTEGVQTISLPYQNPYNYNFRAQRYEKRYGPNATVSDQNYTMREILNRFTSGSPINDMGVYNEFDFTTKEELTKDEFEQAVDDYLPHPKTLDLVERQEYKEKILKDQKNIQKNATKSNKNPQQQPQQAPTDKTETPK